MLKSTVRVAFAATLFATALWILANAANVVVTAIYTAVRIYL